MLKSLRPGLERYLSNTAWLLTEKIIRTLINFFVVAWVARHLGPAQFGVLNFAQSLIFLFAAVATLGVDNILIRELVYKKFSQGPLLFTSLALKLMAALVVISLIFVGLLFSGIDIETKLIISLISFSLLFQSCNVIEFFFQAKVRSRYIAFTNLVMVTISSIIKVCLILTDAPLIAFAAVVTLDAILVAILLIIFFVKSGEQFTDWQFDRTIAEHILSNGFPLFVSGVLVAIYLRIDQVLLHELIGPEVVGQYAVAIRLVDTYNIIPVAVASTLNPAIIAARGAAHYLPRLQALYDILIWSSIAAIIGSLLLGSWFIQITFGEAYLDAVLPFQIQMASSLFLAIGYVTNTWLLAENRQVHMLIRAALGILINVLLNLLMIPMFGPVGAAVATLMTQFSMTLLYMLVIGEIRPLAKMVFRSFNPFSAFIRVSHQALPRTRSP